MNQVLNPKIFNEDSVMIPEVRESLLEVTSLFLDTVKENSEIDIYPSDIWLVGSNASYNYTEYSDIDLHIIVNFDLIDGDPDSLIQSYYNAEKTNFNSLYDFNIRGIDVEVYVEDINTTSVSNGIYSVMTDEWIKYPSPIERIPYDVEEKQLYRDWLDRISDAIKYGSSDTVGECINDLYLLRKRSLSSEGEYGEGNLVFKALRSKGYLDDLKERYYDLLSREISVESIRRLI